MNGCGGGGGTGVCIPQTSNGPPPAKKPRMVFTDAQRRTLRAIFKSNPRPGKDMQVAISQQLGLEMSTVANFFMNSRRRSRDKWQDENGGLVDGGVGVNGDGVLQNLAGPDAATDFN